MFDSFGVADMSLVLDPWKLPTPIRFHACGVNALLFP